MATNAVSSTGPGVGPGPSIARAMTAAAMSAMPSVTTKPLAR
jgi:hypothetical protein